MIQQSITKLIRHNSLLDTKQQSNYLKLVRGFTFIDKQHGTKSRLDYIFVSRHKYTKINNKVVEPFDLVKIDHKLAISVPSSVNLTCNFCLHFHPIYCRPDCFKTSFPISDVWLCLYSFSVLIKEVIVNLFILDILLVN